MRSSERMKVAPERMTEIISGQNRPDRCQRRMWMTAPYFDFANLDAADIQTTMLGPAAAEPATNITIPLRLQNFVGPLPPGEVLPAAADNPLVRGVTVSHPGGSPHTGEWPFDTGAQITILSFRVARDCGLIPAAYGTLAEFMAGHPGPVKNRKMGLEMPFSMVECPP